MIVVVEVRVVMNGTVVMIVVTDGRDLGLWFVVMIRG